MHTKRTEAPVCMACMSPTKQCSRCERSLPKEAFPRWTAKKHTRYVCLDCLHPSCRNGGCRTCKSCREVSCKDPSCSKELKPLNGQSLKALTNVAEYECDQCLFPSCTVCRTDMTKIQRERRRKSAYWKELEAPRSWVCQECEIRGRKRK